MNQGVKTNLAKLLATENLVVEHANVETASFDVVNRVLTLPIWDTSEDVYDLLVGHEVGHALFTPADVIDKSLPSSYVNVVEDARIERMIKSTYPGLLKSFSAGYKELGDKDFFDIEDKNLNDFNLIDRINLYFKLGIHNVSTVIPFKKEEEKFVKLVRDTKTFDEVCEVARQIRQYMEDNKESKDAEELPDFNLDSTGSTGSNNVDITEPEDSDSNDNENQIETETQGGSESMKQSIEEWLDEAEDSMYEDDELEVLTEESFNRNQKRLLSSETWKTITPPQTDWDQYITLNDDFVDDMKVMDAVLDTKKYYSYRWQDEKDIVDCTVHQKWKKDLNEFKTNSKKEVNYLVKEFECRKAAASYARASTSRTGVLDTTKLHTYRYNEDLFKKITTLPDGKNHGLVFVLDWSGSMQYVLQDTLKQLYNLIWFCRKVSIPFDVYAFSNEWSRQARYDGGTLPKHYEESEGLLKVEEYFNMMNILTSKTNAKTLEKQMINIWRIAESFTSSHGHQVFYRYPPRLSLSGTPLNESLVALHQILPKFQKENGVEKTQCIVLTDGEAHQLSHNTQVKRSWEDDLYMGRNRSHGDRCFLRDRKLGRTYRLGWGYHEFTDALIRNLKDKFPSTNFIGIRVLANRDAGSFIRNHTPYEKIENIMKTWRKNKSFTLKDAGYHSYFGLSATALANEDEFEVQQDATKAQIKRAFVKSLQTKKMNKKILGEFIELVV